MDRYEHFHAIIAVTYLKYTMICFPRDVKDVIQFSIGKKVLLITDSDNIEEIILRS